MDEVDREEWDRVWAAMEVRKLEPSDLHVEMIHTLIALPELGEVLSVTISEVPQQYVEGSYFSTESCVLCSSPTLHKDRRPVSVNPAFDRIKGISAFAWVHPECFEKLERSSDPPPIPW